MTFWLFHFDVFHFILFCQVSNRNSSIEYFFIWLSECYIANFSEGNCTQPSSGVVSTAGSTPALSDLPRYPWMALTGGNYTVLMLFCFLFFSFILFFRTQFVWKTKKKEQQISYEVCRLLPLLIDFYDSVAIRDVVYLFGMNIFMCLSIFLILKLVSSFRKGTLYGCRSLPVSMTIIHIENACFNWIWNEFCCNKKISVCECIEKKIDLNCWRSKGSTFCLNWSFSASVSFERSIYSFKNEIGKNLSILWDVCLSCSSILPFNKPKVTFDEQLSNKDQNKRIKVPSYSNSIERRKWNSI